MYKFPDEAEFDREFTDLPPEEAAEQLLQGTWRCALTSSHFPHNWISFSNAKGNDSFWAINYAV